MLLLRSCAMPSTGVSNRIEDWVVINGVLKHEHTNGSLHSMEGFHCEACDNALRDHHGRLRYGEFIALERKCDKSST